MVSLYRTFLSPGLHAISGPLGGCRHYPCCSEYSIEALRRFGFLRGTALTAWRLLRCAPWSKGGCDPVPNQWQEAFGLSKEPSMTEIEVEGRKEHG
jgi:hypothetical protein